MPEKTLSEVHRNWRELYEKGSAALQKKNYDYAIAIYNQVLQSEPGFYECREALRATQFHKAAGGAGFFKKMFGTASSSPQLARAQFMVRSNPQEVLNICEQVLNSDPSNAMAHKLLAEAALNLDFPKTAVLSLEIVYKNWPRDEDVAARLAEALAAAGQSGRAEAIYTELLKARPNDPNLLQAFKNVSARRTLREGGYESLASGEGSYRDILKDEQQAVSLEQESRQVKSEDVASELIAEYKTRLEKEPQNRRLLRSIAELHAQRKEFDLALEYYNQIATAEAGSDPSLEKAISETRVRKLEHEASQLDPASGDYEARRAQLEKEKQEFEIAEAHRRVEKYPNDLALRFELGQVYYNAGRISEAIQEFQKAQNNPHKKIQSLYYLGQCFARRNHNDLAVRTLQNAIKEKPVFDDEKKEIVYALATVYEKMGKKEEAIEQLKQIYEVDIGFRDVAQKVDSYRSNQQ